MNFKETCTLATKSSFTSEQFWSAINIYTRNPHSVSRRLCGIVPLFSGILVEPLLHDIQKLYEKVASCNLNDKSSDQIFELLKCTEIGLDVELGSQKDVKQNVDKRSSITINRLLPRNSDKYSSCLEFVILDKKNRVATFAKLDSDTDGEKPSVATQYPFSVQLVGGDMELLIHAAQPEENSVLWFKTHLFPKLVKWASSTIGPQSDRTVNSLSLVSIDCYTILYQELKKKYGKHMVEIWPEATDPSKFVYEDIAIATYLILLWEKERQEKEWPESKKQSFVDLGCGNGLLVYILNSEGYQGVGLDVRKRGIWDNYPETTKLEIRSLNPSGDCSFPECDWLIGNHSDELTPWIPVWAARSSYNCRFFLLPCCCFDFAGNKYQRQDTSRSVYGEYLEFVRNICITCGFHTEMDRLRIPSTKRTCLVGSRRTYNMKEHEETEHAINLMITTRSANQPFFKPRPATEKVRNCTQLKKGVVEGVVKLVVDALLHETADKGDKWNAGGKKSLGDLAQIIPKETLQELKSECGGLQTLLKNHRFIFQVVGGFVQLREPSLRNSKGTVNQKRQRKRKVGNGDKEPVLKRKNCWFNVHHPDGCPLSSSDCPDVH